MYYCSHVSGGILGETLGYPKEEADVGEEGCRCERILDLKHTGQHLYDLLGVGRFIIEVFDNI